MLPATRSPSYFRLSRFAVVGGIGFLVDGGLLTLLSQYFRIDIYLSRLMSFSVATLVTWVLNRTFVFKNGTSTSGRKSLEYGRYLLVQILGAMTNLLIFTTAIMAHAPMRSVPVIPLAIGAVFGLLVNYFGSHHWVFAKQRSEAPHG